MPPLQELSHRQPDPEHLDQAKEVRVERISHDDPRAVEARALEFEVFEKAGFSEGADGYLEQYGPYDENSIFYVARATDGKAVGMLRVIYAGDDVIGLEENQLSTGFKTLDDFDLYPHWKSETARHLSEHPQEIGEVGTAAVLEDWRATEVADALYKEALEQGLKDGIRYCIASIDADVLAAYRHRKMFPFVDMGPTDPHYMGSPTTPVFMDIYELPDYWRKHNPEFYRKILGGDPEETQQ